METPAISDQPWENNYFLVVASTNGNVTDVQALLEVADPCADDYLALFRALGNGHVECVKALIPGSNIGKNMERALVCAAEAQQIECLKLLLEYNPSPTEVYEALVVCASNNSCDCLNVLLPHTDATLNRSNALYFAAANRSCEAFEILLPVSNPSMSDDKILPISLRMPTPLFQKLMDLIPHPDYITVNNALLKSVNSGSKNLVGILLPKCDVRYRESQALRTALQHDDHAMAELLYEGSDLTLVLNLLRKDPKIKDFQIQRLIELEEAQRQNALLKEVVDGVCTTTKARKM